MTDMPIKIEEEEDEKKKKPKVKVKPRKYKGFENEKPKAPSKKAVKMAAQRKAAAAKKASR